MSLDIIGDTFTGARGEGERLMALRYSTFKWLLDPPGVTLPFREFWGDSVVWELAGMIFGIWLLLLTIYWGVFPAMGNAVLFTPWRADITLPNKLWFLCKKERKRFNILFNQK